MKNLLKKMTLLVFVVLLLGATIVSSASANWVPPEYKWIGGHAASSFSVGVQEATIKFCADNLRQFNVWVELYRDGRVWKYKINPGTIWGWNPSIVSARMWNSDNPVNPSGAPISIPNQARVTRYTGSYNVPCYQVTNIDGTGNTLAGVQYHTIVWYENPDQPGATANPYTAYYPDACYVALNGTHLCDSKSR